MTLKSRLSFGWINRNGKLIIVSHGLCTFARGFIGVLIALYLEKLGFSLIQIGTFLSVSIAGGAFFTFLVSMISEKIGRKRLLMFFTLISALAGLGLVFFDAFLPLMFIAFMGGLQERVGATQTLEQASITDTASSNKRTDLFAVYRIFAVAGTAFGALAAGIPGVLQNVSGISTLDAYRIMFGAFSVFMLIGFFLYSLLSKAIEADIEKKSWVNPLRLRSRKLIFTLAGLFSIDSFASGLFPQSLAAYWFYTRFGVELEALALVFFVSHLLAAISLWVAAKLANKIGLINTMVFTHIPCSLFLIAAALSPKLWIAVIFWQLRAFFSRMDVPTRDSYTMSLVQADERVAMASVHAVGRSVTGTVAPSIATVLWQAFTAAVPLVSHAVLKITYDLSLYFMFRNVKPPQEADRTN
jgi:MFS family permease